MCPLLGPSHLGLPVANSGAKTWPILLGLLEDFGLRPLGWLPGRKKLSHTHHPGRSQSLPRLGGVSPTKFRSSILATVQKANTQAPSSHLPPPSRVCLPSHLPHAAFLILPPQLRRSLPFLHPFQHLGPGTQYLVCTSMAPSPQFPHPWPLTVDLRCLPIWHPRSYTPLLYPSLSQPGQSARVAHRLSCL